MRFTNKEKRENIEEMNIIMGTRHRTKPYNFKKSQDIIEATVMATAEYVDLQHYCLFLYSIEEAFDESLEHYCPEAWISIGSSGTTNNTDYDNAMESLRETIDYFQIVVDKSEKKCRDMWKIALINSSEDVIKHFWGEVIKIDQDRLEMILDENMFEIFDGIDFDGVIENSAIEFANILKNF